MLKSKIYKFPVRKLYYFPLFIMNHICRLLILIIFHFLYVIDFQAVNSSKYHVLW